MWHFSIFDDWFLGLNCFEILNVIEGKYLLKPYLALCQKVFLPKALKTVFQKSKMHANSETAVFVSERETHEIKQKFFS